MLKFLRKHTFLTIVIILALAAGLFFAFMPKDETASMTEIAVKKGDITTYNSFVGNVAASSSRKVIAMASEQVAEVLVEKGDEVHEGDVILKLDTENIEYTIKKTGASINQAAKSAQNQIKNVEMQYENYKEYLDEGVYTAYTQAKNGLHSAGIAYDNAEDAYDAMYDPIREMKKAVKNNSNATATDFELVYQDLAEKYIKYINAEKSCSPNTWKLKQEYEDAEDKLMKPLAQALALAEDAYNLASDSYESVKIQIDQQLASLELAIDTTKNAADMTTTYMDYNKLKDSLEDYTITAPCDGVITALVPDVGDIVSQGMTVAVISSLDEMEISISVDEYSILNTSEGAPVTIYIDSIGKSYDGVISYVSDVAVVSGGVSYYEATVKFTPDEDVRSGMSVEVRLVRINEKDVLTLPSDAINYNEDNTAFVYVKDESGKITEKPVSLGVSDGSYVQITSGLSEGESIFYTPKVFNPYDMWMM